MPHTSHRPWPRLAWRWAGLWLLLALSWGAAAQPASAVQRESAVKAAFLYKFPGFVDWPSGTFQRPDDPLVIAVWGNEAVAADLEQIAAGRAHDGRPITVRRVREGDAVAGAHVLLVGAAREPKVREAPVAAGGPILVVTEQDNGHRLGGVLNFVTDAGRVRFTASVAAAEARGLRLSARLLAVAQSVDGRAR